MFNIKFLDYAWTPLMTSAVFCFGAAVFDTANSKAWLAGFLALITLTVVLMALDVLLETTPKRR